jgi:predicted O-linked N-acetylglucosamine transferase (SPINDLY family)
MRVIRHSIDVASLLAKAVDLHQAGDLEAAQEIYAEILAEVPNNFDALHLLGVLRHQQGRNEEARALIMSAISINPKSMDALGNLGIVLQELGRHVEAVGVYDRALAIDPRHPEALNNRGIALRALNRPAAAIMSFDRAIAIKPDYLEAHFNRAALLTGLGRFDEAVASYDQLIATRPESFEAHRGRGRALQAQQKLEAALLSYARAMILRPDDPEVRFDRGVALNGLGRHREALGEFDKVLAQQPDNAAALAQRGIALQELKRYPEAEVALARALSMRPDDAVALDTRGAALQGLGRPAEALGCHDRALAMKPANAGALNNRGHALLALKRYGDALESYDRALAFAPAGARALVNRGIALHALRQYREALECFDAAVALAPEDAEAHRRRAETLLVLGNHAGALESFEKTLVLRTPLAAVLDRLAVCVAKLCDWSRADEVAHQLDIFVRDGTSVVAPSTLIQFDSTPEQQLACARQYLRDHVPEVSVPFRGTAARNRGKLRVAYLAANFNRRALKSLVAGLFERHDRTKFEITGISYGLEEDAASRTRTISALDAFHDLRGSDDREIAQRLHDLGIDIAVDLMGHGPDARPGILAPRPAPIQVSYLGYPGTTGADFIDYVIADATVVPRDEDGFYTESVVRLPDCFQINDAGRVIAEATPTRKDAGLPEKGFVFASFNSGIISAPVFDTWMGMLARIEGSVLWLLDMSEGAKFNLRQHASARGVDPDERLIFAPRIGQAEHLARHRLADLFLDTLPCSSGTATSDALWAGLPVLTCRGTSFAGRIAASQLRCLGLNELVTSSFPEYAALAQWLAEDRDILGEIKKRLAETRTTSPLFDTDLMRRNLEEAYITMWALRQGGRRGQGFDVEAPPPPPPPPRVQEAAAGPAGVSDAAAPAPPLGSDAAAPNDPAAPAGAAPLAADAPIAPSATPKSEAAAPAGSDAQS